MTLKNDAKFEEQLTCRFKIDMRNWRILTQAPESLKNVHLNVLHLSKVYIVWAKKVQRSWHRRLCKIWRGIDLSFQNWHEEFDKFWPEHSKVSKIFTLIGSFWAKYILFQLKKYRGVIFHNTEEWCKIWRKTDLRFGKWLGEFGNFSPDHLKVSKLGFWRDPLTQSRKCLSLKLTEELCVMTMKNDAKFEQEWTCCFKIYRNLTNSDLFVNLKDMLFYWVIWPQYIMFELKKVMFDGTEDWCKIWR